MPGPNPRSGLAQITAHMAELPQTGGEPPSTLLASNECALGPSPRAVAAAKAALDDLHLYPEGGQDRLKAAIGARFDLAPERIVCGHGSDDLLSRLARAYLRPGDELLYSAHGYQKFPKYARAEDARPMAAPDRDLRADVDALLDRVSGRTRLVMLANPDNPSGLCLAGNEVRRLHAGLPEEVLLVLDSAYGEFVDQPDYEAPERLITEADNVVMTRTFSKLFGLAGARLGWLYGPPAAVKAVTRIGAAYPISAPAAAAGIAALEDRAFTDAVLAHSRHWRARLAAALGGLGLTVYPSQTNFVLVRFDDPAKPMEAAYAALAARGLLARRFIGPDFARHLRITLGPAAALEALIATLEDFVAGAS